MILNFDLTERAGAHSAARRRRQNSGPGERPRGPASLRGPAVAVRPIRPAGTVRPEAAQPARPSWMRWVASLSTGLRSKLRRMREQRRAARMLSALNDRMLKDIGISRSELEYLQHGGPTKHMLR
jgi:uncharacterized protein YjiS (DUF1127 family)